ncbi:MAG: transcriptional regulator [Pseudolabrys sp.]
MNELPNLDPTFHQPVRTRLAVLLSQGPVSFSKLKGALQITDGNLDAHLRKLSATGYLHTRSIFDGRYRTDYCLSSSGTKAFLKYLRDLRRLIESTAVR